MIGKINNIANIGVFRPFFSREKRLQATKNSTLSQLNCDVFQLSFKGNIDQEAKRLVSKRLSPLAQVMWAVDKCDDLEGMDSNQKTLLHHCKRPEFAKYILKVAKERGIDPVELVNKKDKDGNTALYYLQEFYPEAVGLYVLNGVEDSSNNNGEKFLHTSNKPKLVVAYLNQGADPNVRDSDGNTPLFHQRDPIIIKALIRNGADVNAVNKMNQNALHFAKDERIVEILAKEGCNIDLQDNLFGYTPLHYAKNDKVSKALAKAGARVDIKDKSGCTPLHTAKNARIAFDVIDAAREQGLDIDKYINQRDNHWYTPLHHAKESSHACTLIREGANPDLKDRRGRTPLHYAETVAMMEKLLEGGANPNIKDRKGRTPLHYARNINQVDYLVHYGADIDAKDNKDKTTYDLAILEGRTEVANYIIELKKL